MAKVRLSWGHETRYCFYCGKKGPRTLIAFGYAHKKCIPAKEPLKVKRPLAIRRGDTWRFTTNNGVIVRNVRSVAMDVVSYLCNGRLVRCSIECFRRWARGAELTSAEDWEGRNGN